MQNTLEQRSELRWVGYRRDVTEPALRSPVERLRSILESWDGTPYLHGQSVKGRGVDCVRFVASVLCEMDRRPLADLKRLPLDTSLHNPAMARAFFHDLLRTFAPTHRVEDGQMEPGDFIVMRRRERGPGHAIIVGPDENTVWHSDPGAGVCKTGLGVLFMNPLYELDCVVRISNRERWV